MARQQPNPPMGQQETSTNMERSAPLSTSTVMTQREGGFELILIPDHEEECRKGYKKNTTDKSDGKIKLPPKPPKTKDHVKSRKVIETYLSNDILRDTSWLSYSQDVNVVDLSSSQVHSNPKDGKDEGTHDTPAVSSNAKSINKESNGK
ncbi:hypothetical protein JHK85_009981 [Glycine max]|nr:hypothetical protein JHK85_009981 [Glycine max]